MVALPLLRSHGIRAQSYLVSLDHVSLPEQLERALLLENHDPIGAQRFVRRLREHGCTQQPDSQASEHPDAHARDYSGAIPHSATLVE